MPQFQIRQEVGPEDTAFIIAAFDSTLPHLASIGSGSQWGSQRWSEKEDFPKLVQKYIEDSEVHRTTGEGENIRVFIAEVEGANLDANSGGVPQYRKGD